MAKLSTSAMVGSKLEATVVAGVFFGADHTVRVRLVLD